MLALHSGARGLWSREFYIQEFSSAVNFLGCCSVKQGVRTIFVELGYEFKRFKDVLDMATLCPNMSSVTLRHGDLGGDYENLWNYESIIAEEDSEEDSGEEGEDIGDGADEEDGVRAELDGEHDHAEKEDDDDDDVDDDDDDDDDDEEEEEGEEEGKEQEEEEAEQDTTYIEYFQQQMGLPRPFDIHLEIRVADKCYYCRIVGGDTRATRCYVERDLDGSYGGCC